MIKVEAPTFVASYDVRQVLRGFEESPLDLPVRVQRRLTMSSNLEER